MKLFYTAISKPGVQQNRPTLSLGGFKSASQVSNDALGALFGSISQRTIKQNLSEYIGLICENTMDYPVTNIEIWMPKIPGNFAVFQLAVVELNTNKEMESIPTVHSKPIHADFYDTDIGDPISLGDAIMMPGDQFGIWVKRSLDLSVDGIAKSANCDYLYSNFEKPNTKNPIEEQSINISFENSQFIYCATTSPIYKVGDEIQIKITFLPANAIGPFTYTSLVPSIISVDDNGLCEALGVGVAEIEVKSSNGVIGICKFEIIKA